MPEAISLTNSIFYNFLFPFFVKRSDYFFTVSEHSKNEMVNYLHIDADKITVVHNGIDLSEFSPAGKNEKEAVSPLRGDPPAAEKPGQYHQGVCPHRRQN